MKKIELEFNDNEQKKSNFYEKKLAELIEKEKTDKKLKELNIPHDIENMDFYKYVRYTLSLEQGLDAVLYRDEDGELVYNHRAPKESYEKLYKYYDEVTELNKQSESEYCLDIKDFIIKTDEHMRALNHFQSLLDNVDQDKQLGMYISGETMIGKTTLLKIMKKEFLKRGKKVVYISSQRLMMIFQKYMFDIETKMRMLDAICDVDVLMIDDIFSESLNATYIKDVLLSIMSVRRANNKLTMYTSNYKLNRLMDLFTSSPNVDETCGLQIIERINSTTKEFIFQKKVAEKSNKKEKNVEVETDNDFDEMIEG